MLDTYNNLDNPSPFLLTRLKAVWLSCLYCMGIGLEPVNNTTCPKCNGKGKVKAARC